MHLMKYYFVFFFSIYIQQVYNNSTPAYPQDDASIFQDSNCYKGLGYDSIFLAAKFHESIIYPPKILDSYTTMTPYINNIPRKPIEVRIYFILTTEKCKTSVSLHFGTNEYSKIAIIATFFVGLNNRQKFTQFLVDIHQNIQTGWNLYSDTYKLMQIFARVSEQPILNAEEIRDVKTDQIHPSIEDKDFDSEYICISNLLDFFVIKPDFENRKRNIPSYKGLFIHVYSNGQPVMVKRVNAWPCGNNYPSFNSKKPILVTDDISKPTIYWTFENYHQQEGSSQKSLEQLQLETYFQTDSLVETISSQNDWLGLTKRIFIVKSEMHFLPIKDKPSCNRLRSINGHRTYSIIQRPKFTESQRGYSYTQYRRVTDAQECASAKRSIPSPVDAL